MISTALAVLAVGIPDFVAGGLRGNPDVGRRAAWGLLSAAVVLLPLIWSKSSLFAGWFAFLICLVGVAAWLLLMVQGSLAAGRAWLALAVLATYLTLAVALSGVLQQGAAGWLDHWLDALPFESLARLSVVTASAC